ncbi:hypothetical protein A2V71_02875 [Candidatus Berkelbacteria bacterium RBG_13_40_8]|uniref:DUF4145 domain-containing protein n=1 Tax=Candidatus Berkelbacteria bacterium RBG_13_40_8 TaxID=1797467 RepID=A0A1F5DM79_9BACT|nr:MAG: hypothetical protein A2V71_02875 [Candidatus Berkelbacteria bacterium RBG_13_40_8]
MGYRVHQYHKTTEQKAVEGFLKGLWWLISLPFRLIFGKRKSVPSSLKEGGLDQQYVSQKWQEIQQLMQLGRPSNYSRAVLEADKLLDHVLKGYRVPGLTMGDRLKAARKRFSPEAYDAAWKAHKVRNELVHNSEFQLMDYQAKETIENFKKALKELIDF